MMIPVQIKNRTFEKSSFGGYRPEDVDAFLDELYQDYDRLYRENSQMIKKMQVLVEKIEEYRSEESTIQSAFLSAQKAGDAIVREAQHKAELILQDATIKADKMIGNTQREILRQSEALDQIQQEVGRFKQRLLSIYKEHLSLISALPEPEKKAEEETLEPESKPEQPAEEIAEEISPDAKADQEQQPEQTPEKEQPKEEKSEPAPAPAPEKKDDAQDEKQPSAEEIRRPLSSFGMKFGEHYDMSADDDYSSLGKR